MTHADRVETIEAKGRRREKPVPGAQSFYSLSELAARWRVSRSAVYVYLRGYPVLDFAPAPGRRGHKIVSADVVRQIERERERVMR
jgi:hypothetical protein